MSFSLIYQRVGSSEVPTLYTTNKKVKASEVASKVCFVFTGTMGEIVWMDFNFSGKLPPALLLLQCTR